MSDFKTIKCVGFSRERGAEKLMVQLTQTDTRAFVSMAHFWLKEEDGVYYPPSRKKPRIIIRPNEAQAVIDVLRELIELSPPEAAPAPVDRSRPGRGGVWSEAASGVVDIGRHRERMAK